MEIFVRKSVLIIIDILFINLSVFLATELRFDFNIPAILDFKITYLLLLSTIIHLLFFYFFGLYHSLWRYMSIDELIKLIIASSLSYLIIYILNSFLYLKFPRSILMIALMLTIILTGGLRLGYRIIRRVLHRYRQPVQTLKRVMIIGGGDAGSMIIKEIKNNAQTTLFPVVVIDDAKWKENSLIHGVPVRYGIGKLSNFVQEYNVDEIFIAIPSLTKSRLSEIVKIAQATHCRVKTLPSISDIVEDKVELKNIRDVNIEDLLGRDETKLDVSSIQKYIKNEVVLVTGGGGSIGSELCRQIAKFEPKELIILDIYENNAFELQNDLNHMYPNLFIQVLIASVRDAGRIDQIFSTYKPNIVFHAAAHKHVPLMEFNPQEAIKNNILGTLNVASSSNKYNTKRFVLISTDKAVNPTNIMGASKRIAEMIIQSINRVSETEFVAVRFGNVLGSNGSVIPTFKKQIEWGGPVTVTHPDITRFFMTIPEASRLVLQAGAIAKGGEIFVLDMGSPVKIIDLAKQLIILSGFEPDIDIAIEYTGLRPGEKLYEELMLSEEGTEETLIEGIFIAKPNEIEFGLLINQIEKLINLDDTNLLREKIKQLVPTYKYSKGKF